MIQNYITIARILALSARCECVRKNRLIRLIAVSPPCRCPCRCPTCINYYKIRFQKTHRK